MTRIFGREREKERKKTIQPVAPDGRNVHPGHFMKWVTQKTFGHAKKERGRQRFPTKQKRQRPQRK